GRGDPGTLDGSAMGDGAEGKRAGGGAGRVAEVFRRDKLRLATQVIEGKPTNLHEEAAEQRG
ncbi:MAG: hypothetical protein ACM359_24505, partial [Bacillota bacterium]